MKNLTFNKNRSGRIGERKSRSKVNTDWDRHKIRYELARKGYVSLLTLDANNGFKPATISNAIGEPHKKGEQVIAKVLNVPPHVIWPSRYYTKGKSLGKRLSPQPSENYRRRNAKGKSQKGAEK